VCSKSHLHSQSLCSVLSHNDTRVWRQNVQQCAPQTSEWLHTSHRHWYAEYNNVDKFPGERFLFDISRKMAAPLLCTCFRHTNERETVFSYSPLFGRKNSSILDRSGEKIGIFIFGLKRMSIGCAGFRRVLPDIGFYIHTYIFITFLGSIN
jgi:hypothetical protein